MLFVGTTADAETLKWLPMLQNLQVYMACKPYKPMLSLTVLHPEMFSSVNISTSLNI